MTNEQCMALVLAIREATTAIVKAIYKKDSCTEILCDLIDDMEAYSQSLIDSD